MNINHNVDERETLRRAGMSMQTELDEEGQRRLAEATAEDWSDRDKIFRYVMKHDLRNQEEVTEMVTQTNEQGETITMAKTTTKTKSAGRPKKAAPTKSQINQVASMRRDGATWDEIIAETGVKTNSTGFRILLEDNGFDKFGRKGGKGTSKAKGWGSADNAKPAAKKAPAKKKVVRKKATAKK